MKIHILKKTAFALAGILVIQTSVPIMAQEKENLSVQGENVYIENQTEGELEEVSEINTEERADDLPDTLVQQEDTTEMPEKEEKDVIYGSGWYYESGEGWYFYNNGIKVKGWLNVGGKWYYLDPENAEHPGLMVSDCSREIGGRIYGFQPNGAMAAGWYYRAGEGWYYHEQSGARKTGWVKVSNVWYYLNPENAEHPGLMVSDCSREIGGRTYGFQPNGAMAAGWYYRAGEGWYYHEQSGARKTGWVKVSNVWYYLDPENAEHPGLMVSDCSREIGGRTYGFQPNGAMAAGWYYRAGEGWYYHEQSGARKTGWVKVSNVWYYLDPENAEHPGLMVSDCSREIGGRIYGFQSNGAMAAGWYYRSGEGWYYHEQSGARKTGWVKVSNVWYYLDPENAEHPGLMVSDCIREIAGKTYEFLSNGAMRTGWYRETNTWYYYDDYTGQRVLGWKKVGGHWYYFGTDGGAKTGWQMINKDWYYFYTANDRYGGPEAAMAVNQIIDNWYIGSSGKAYSYAKITDIMTYTYVPYVSGGTTPAGWDCSGFTQWALKYLGVNIPRLSHQQAVGGSWVNPADMSSWNPGDILVYSTNGYAGHVALYLGNGMLMHSLNEKYGTLIQSVAYYDWWDTGTYLSGVRRYL